MYAHTKPGQDKTHWEPLTVHLNEVAHRASTFAAAFGAAELAKAAGWWHDLGKASQAFQRDVLGSGGDEAAANAGDDTENQHTARRRRIDHSTAGARHAAKQLGSGYGALIAYGILGHHGRLPDHSGDGSDATFKHRMDPLSYTIEPVEPAHDIPHTMAPETAHTKGFDPGLADDPLRAFRCSLLIRMLYSALVDADRLATEHFCDPERAAQRPATSPTPQMLRQMLDTHLEALRNKRAGNPAPVDTHRAQVLAACRKKSDVTPGIFTLTVPTGGGKTLASMAFALGHAQHHGQRRVLVALPYTSIIEQTAQTYRRVFGDTHILEHHSNLDQATRNRRGLTQQMAAENFDAPIVVTTNVQLFESLFSSHGSTCRKLHRIAQSVIILDEAQSIPPHLLRPTLAVLQELVRNYGCTVVLCTATQPAINLRPDFPIGLDTTEIIPNPKAVYQAMRRVEVSQQAGLLDDKILAGRLAEHPQALCVVNTKKHAAALTKSLLAHAHAHAHDTEAVVHLSAAMCPQHRSELVAHIKQRLDDNLPITVVSTQVIEAGVDVDFPVVYRSIAGFDSIAQAAGRCNREGRRDTGHVFLFATEHSPPKSLRAQIDAARDLLPDHPDPLALDAIESYFRRVYWRRSHEGKKAWDTQDVMGCFKSETIHQFREADSRFRWIDSPTTAIIVPHGKRGPAIIDHLRTADEPDWQLLRDTQRYSVSIRDHQLDVLRENTAVTECFDGRFWILNNPDAYDDLLGLRFDVEGWKSEDLTL